MKIGESVFQFRVILSVEEIMHLHIYSHKLSSLKITNRRPEEWIEEFLLELGPQKLLKECNLPINNHTDEDIIYEVIGNGILKDFYFESSQEYDSYVVFSGVTAQIIPKRKLHYMELNQLPEYPFNETEESQTATLHP